MKYLTLIAALLFISGCAYSRDGLPTYEQAYQRNMEDSAIYYEIANDVGKRRIEQICREKSIDDSTPHSYGGYSPAANMVLNNGYPILPQTITIIRPGIR